MTTVSLEFKLFPFRMVINVIIISCYSIFTCVRASGYTGATQDQTSARPNTLFDDADDIQKQLDNEARDRYKYGQAKTIWVLHFPTQYPILNSISEVQRRPRTTYNFFRRKRKEIEECNNSENAQYDTLPDTWTYDDQHLWPRKYPSCGGRSQSPIDVPVQGLIKTRGARELLFCNYDVLPKSLTATNDGKRVIMSGVWEKNLWPIVYGGAAHSRRYLFHSLTVYWPSEHAIGGLQYPMETQLLHISADYATIEEAIRASARDPQAFLGIANIFKFGEHTQPGLRDLLKTVLRQSFVNSSMTPKPLSYFNPGFKNYACYQGSLTTPPCTESVLWLVRGRTLTVTRGGVEAAYGIFGSDDQTAKFFIRRTQALNDRKIFVFN